jgi:hypothetical protein
MVTQRCTNCQTPLQEGWKVCPKCALPTGPSTPEGAIGLILTKIVGGILDAGFHAQASDAETKGESDRAYANEAARRITREIEGTVSSAILAWDRKVANEREDEDDDDEK